MILFEFRNHIEYKMSCVSGLMLRWLPILSEHWNELITYKIQPIFQETSLFLFNFIEKRTVCLFIIITLLLWFQTNHWSRIILHMGLFNSISLKTPTNYSFFWQETEQKFHSFECLLHWRRNKMNEEKLNLDVISELWFDNCISWLQTTSHVNFKQYCWWIWNLLDTLEWTICLTVFSIIL